MTLYAHQQRFLSKNPDKALLVHGLGSGKTRTAIEWAKKRGEPLIVCPKGIKEHWRRECEKWGLVRFEILSKEEFKKKCKEYKNKVLICDESDWFYSPHFKSQLSKALRWYVNERKPAILMLTATPMRSSAWNVFQACWFLGIKLNFFQFKNDHFYEIRMGFRTIPKPKKDSAEKIRKLLRKVADIFNPEDEYDIPPQIDEVVELGESKEQENAHKENIEIQPIVRFTRDHQIEAGIGVSEAGDAKKDRILTYASDWAKMAVICRYRDQLEDFKELLEGKGYKVWEIHGGKSGEERQAVLDEVEKAEKGVLLVQSATCEGWEAPSIGLMVFASMSYSFRDLLQMKGRIARLNRLKKNIYVYLLAGRCDKAIYSSMENKKNFDILEYYKKNGKTPKN